MLEIATLDDRISAELVEPAGQLRELARFDGSLEAKIHSLQVMHVMGTDFGRIAKADEFDPIKETQPPEAGGVAEVIDSYYWATALAAYPYRHHKNQKTIRNTAFMSLIEAIKTYSYSGVDPFIDHLSANLTTTMAKAYGPSYDAWVPKPAEFQAYVVQCTEDWTPLLPDRRQPEDLPVGENVWVLDEQRATRGRITDLKQRDQEVPIIPNYIPEDELPVVRERLERKDLDFKLRDEAAGPDEARATEDFVKVPNELTDWAVHQLHALGRLPMWVYAEYPQLRINPDAGASTATVRTETGSRTEEVRDARVIPFPVLRAMGYSPLHREIHLDNLATGSPNRRQLRELVNNQKQLAVPIVDRAARRARPRRDLVRQARVNARLHYGNGI